MSVPDVVIKAKIKDETGDGASKMAANFEKNMHRLFTDQKTTGLDPLGRALSQMVGDKLGSTLAIGGVAVIGTQLDEASGKALIFANQLKNGETDARGIAHGIAESVPILGSFVSMWDNVREIITGEKRELEITNEV